MIAGSSGRFSAHQRQRHELFRARLYGGRHLIWAAIYQYHRQFGPIGMRAAAKFLDNSQERVADRFGDGAGIGWREFLVAVGHPRRIEQITNTGKAGRSHLDHGRHLDAHVLDGRSGPES
jgi:hypothetical protein